MTRDRAAAGGGDPPPTIEGYELGAVLGSGATGVVYRARQLSMDRIVALKVLHAGAVSSPRAVQRLQREARTAARLSHPNIVSAIDMGHVDATWWFAMELVEGRSLAERLEHGGRLSERQALDLFVPLCDALQHAAERGVVHRDVKPANILVEADGRPRLVDLGLARVEEDPLLTRSGATLGTPHYISPEQARDPSLTDARSDLWSLGATLFHVVTGEPPFTGESAAEILSAVLYEPIPDPAELRPELSRGLCLVLRKCLSRRIESRYFTANELKEDLVRVRERKAPAVKRAQLEPLESDRRRRSRYRAAGIAVVIAVVAFGLTAWAPWSGSEGDADADAAAGAGAWQPLVELERDLAAGAVDLERGYARLKELGEVCPPHQLERWEAVRRDWYARFEDALWRLKRGGERELRAHIEAREFDAAEKWLEVGARRELVQATGFLVRTLADRPRLEYQSWLEGLREELEAAREAALDQARAALAGYRDQLLPQRVAARRSQSDWRGAIGLLEAPLEDHLEAAGADLAGLDEERVAALDASFSAWARDRAAALRNELWKLDDDLRREVNERAQSARVRLESRELRRVADEFRAALEQRLAANGIAPETLPEDVESRALAALDQRVEELADLEDALFEREALERLDALEERTQPLFAERRYGEARRLWMRHVEEPALAPVKSELELRLREAMLLEGVLQRAADALRAAHGEERRLRIERVSYEGTLRVLGDPLAAGFELELPTGRVVAFRLVGPEGAPGGTLLDPRTLEELAGPPRDLEDRLGRALMFYHEDDFDRARAALDAADAEDESLLAYELDVRLEAARGAAAEELAARRDQARREYDSLLEAERRGGDPRKLLRRIEELLRVQRELAGGAFEPHESERLRRMRRELREGYRPAEREDFVRVFEPDEVTFPAFGRVRLRWTFDGAEAGAWDRGDWFFDGAPGWIGHPRRGDDEVSGRPAPTLLLRDPFVVDEGVVAVEVRFAQPTGAPPDLFVISVLGFHAAFAGRQVGQPARVLVDTTSLEDVVRRVRDEGAAFEGWREGEEHVLRLRGNPTRGTAEVRTGGERLTRVERSSPVGGPRSTSISVRSREPVRLLEVTIEGDRR